MNRRKAIYRFLLPSLFWGILLLQGCASIEPAAGKQTAQLLPDSIATVNNACTQYNRAVQDYFGLINKIKKEQPDLVQILTKFPKGADLHNHISGTVMPEDYVALGSSHGDCFGPDSLVPAMYKIARTTNSGVCDSGFKPLVQASTGERQQLLRSLSMYQFNDKGITSIQAGHDHFFATFGRFGAVYGSPNNMGPILAKLLQQSNGENASYVETMISFQSKEISRLADLLRQKYPDAAAYTQSSNYPAMFNYLLSVGLKDVVVAAQNDVVTYVNAVNAILKCGTATPDAACEVSFYFQAAVNRNAALKNGSADLPKIFTQTAFSCLLADTEKSVVGVNLLSGEDSPVSMQSFNTQMQFFSYFHNRFPRMNIALHDGEITPCFVGTGNPALKEHITGSIQAGAKRVGHAVSFTYLNDADKEEVAALMKRNNTLVEIPFTSNAQILGVTGEEHPFVQYFRKYGVPVAFSTDDEGVSYADFTSEWIYAVSQYRLTFVEAIRLARFSLQYSFLPGEPLWQDVVSEKVVSQCTGEILGNDNPAELCKNFLAKSAKAGMQWRYEAKLSHFDKEYGAVLRKYLSLSN
jgi:adenosine deaminase